LLDNKIEDINVKDTIGRTPIFDAVLQGDIETYNFLLSRGAKTDVVVNGDISLLDEASTTGDLNFFRQVYYTSGLPINEETFPKSELKKHVWDSEILIFIEREIAFTKLQNN
jgi:hypothetical protein